MKKTLAQTCMALAFAGILLAANGCIGNSSTTGIDIDDSFDKPLVSVEKDKGENTIRLCSDGIDNDDDTLVDCEDNSCHDRGPDGVSGPGATVCIACAVDPKECPLGYAENNDYTCSDGKDNDGDGYVDCRDRSCYNTFVCCPNSQPENTEDACSDGLDNDCNGYVDCNDNACKKSTDPKVKEYCENKVCGDKCAASENSIQLCTDGVDNDMNGYIDCKDRNCESFEVCVRLNEDDLVEICNDKVDNDLDGRTDCDDPDCEDDQECEDVEPETGARPSNFALFTDAEKLEVYKNEYRLCTDGIDNDKNGKTDCDEYRCQVLSLTDLSALEKDGLKLNIDCKL